MKQWQSDTELFDLAKRELFSAVVGDVLDKMGLLHQFLPPQIQPLREDMVVIGRAMTVLEADMIADAPVGNANPLLSKPFGLLLEALDDLKSGEVYVSSGGTSPYALWGELMTTRAMKLGAVGAVLNGYSRDTRGILALNFPVFAHGRYAQDQAPRGKVLDFRVPVQVGQARVETGDVVFGDMDGVVVVPKNAVDEAFTLALEKARGEKLVQQAIENGMSAVDAFKKYGIL